MAIKSNNSQGNPYHDEATGEFTSADSTGNKQEKVQNTPNQSSEQPNSANAVVTQPTEPSKVSKFSKFRLKNNTNMEDMKMDLRKSNQISSIPVLYSARDIVDHLEEFFPEEVVKKMDSYFGKFSIPYKYFNLRTDSEQRCGCNIFAACIGKKRWKDNYMKLINQEEYNKMANNYRFTALYRGLRGTDSEVSTIANSYASKENEMIYGSVGGTCYGIAIYTSSRFGDAVSYAGGFDNHVMRLMLDKNSVTMSYNQLCNIRNDISRNYTETIKSRVEQIFLRNGIEPSKAKQMAVSFGDYTITDEGFIAMLCGVEWYKDGSYHMISNAGRVYKLLK